MYHELVALFIWCFTIMAVGWGVVGAIRMWRQDRACKRFWDENERYFREVRTVRNWNGDD